MRNGSWIAAAAAALVVTATWAQGQNGPPPGGPGAGPGQGQQGPGQNRPGNQRPGPNRPQGPGAGAGPGAGGPGGRPGAGDQNRPGPGAGPGSGGRPPVHRPPAHRPGSGSQYRPGAPRPPHHFLSQGRWRPSIRGPAFRYPPGYGYRLWVSGAILPRIFLSSAYYYNDYGLLGLGPPPPGYRWLRYGPDLLLVQVFTGRIADVVEGVFY